MCQIDLCSRMPICELIIDTLLVLTGKTVGICGAEKCSKKTA